MVWTPLDRRATWALIAALMFVLVPWSEARQAQASAWVESITGMQFVLVPAGSFVMGSPPGEAAVDDADEHQHRVTVSRSYYIGRHEVTKAQFRVFVEATGYVTEAESAGFSYVLEDGAFVEREVTWRDMPEESQPVVHVTWNDAVAFTEWLSRETGHRVRLPTEAEWEYAARAGSTGAFPGEPDLIAWHRGNSDGVLHAVGEKAPNAWGLFDVVGNALEWVADWHGEYPAGAVTDPQGPQEGTLRVMRSGTFTSNLDERAGRVADRHEAPPDTSSGFLSFRIVRELP